MRFWLSVDFDYFVREETIWDLGHREDPLFREALWDIRVQGFASNGTDLRKEMSPEAFAKPTPSEFWNELEKKGFKFNDTTRLVVADSHTWAALLFGAWWPGKVPKNHRTLVSFDAHHDLAYSQENARQATEKQCVDCAAWLLFVMQQWKHLRSHVVYPPWRGLKEWERSRDSFKGFWYGDTRQRVNASVWDKDIPTGVVDQIYICRSGSWVPPWLDHQFIDFVHDIASRTLADLEVPFINEEHCDPMKPRNFDYDAIYKQSQQVQRLVKDPEIYKRLKEE